MLMMFSSALRKAPFERALPFNENDLMILVNENIGFRLCNVTTEDGQTFTVNSFITSKPEIFGKQSFNDRIKEFADIFDGRVERFFVTKKSDYIFFDTEEQKFLRKLMSKGGLSCSVEIYRYSKNASPQKIEFLDLEYDESVKVSKFLSACKVRAVVNCRDYYFMSKAKHDETKQRRAKYGEARAKTDDSNKYFDKYQKLHLLESKEKVNLYFKLLTVKYHPDREGGDNDICATIRSDFDEVKLTRWYNNLRDKEDGGKM